MMFFKPDFSKKEIRAKYFKELYEGICKDFYEDNEPTNFSSLCEELFENVPAKVIDIEAKRAILHEALIATAKI